MTARKQPQDHKPKASAPLPESAVVVSVRDIDWTIDTDLMNDIEFLEGVESLNEGDMTRLPAFVRMLLGPDQYEAAKNAVRDNGRVRPADLMDLVKDILAGPSSAGESLGESSAS